jgi:hypothetical protein
MTASATMFVEGVTDWDFTSGTSRAYAVAAVRPCTTETGPMKVLPDGKTALFAGDANVDAQIQALDFNAFLASTVSGVTGYEQADFNLDGEVQALDFNLYLANTLVGASSQVP